VNYKSRFVKVVTLVKMSKLLGYILEHCFNLLEFYYCSSNV
jgi:hypothetical protein